jgi:hypothetical protein
MPHDRWMGLVQTLLELDAPLTGEDERDRRRVLDALRAGRTSIVVPPLGDPLQARVALDGGRLSIDAPAGTVARVVTIGGGVAELPAPCEVDVVAPLRVELLRQSRDGAATRWILTSPVRGGQAPSSS